MIPRSHHLVRRAMAALEAITSTVFETSYTETSTVTEIAPVATTIEDGM